MHMASADERTLRCVPLESIAPASRNAKRHNRTGIVNSIRTEGFIDALIVDGRTQQLVSGHGRLEALRWMRDNNEPPPAGIDTDGNQWLVPVQTGWSSRDDQHAAAAAIALNRWVERGGWDNSILTELLTELGDYSDELLAVAGYTNEELDQLVKHATEVPAEFRQDNLDDFADPKLTATHDVTCPECGHTWTP